ENLLRMRLETQQGVEGRYHTRMGSQCGGSRGRSPTQQETATAIHHAMGFSSSTQHGRFITVYEIRYQVKPRSSITAPGSVGGVPATLQGHRSQDTGIRRCPGVRTRPVPRYRILWTVTDSPP